MKKFFCILCCLCLCGSMAMAEGSEQAGMKQAVQIRNDQMIIGEDLHISSDREDVTGLSVSADGGETREVTVSGSVLAERRPLEQEITDTKAYGVTVSAQGADTALCVSVEGNVSAEADVIEGNADAGAVTAEVTDGGSAVICVSGDVTAAAKQETGQAYTWAAGVSVYGSDGRAEVTVNGNVQAESDVYGVGLNSRLSGETDTLSKIRVNGDVTGTSLGILAEQSNPSGRTEVIVDGTVRGRDAAILLSDHPENALITVWKAEPNAKGRIIESMDEDMPDEAKLVFEKAIRYILRFRPGDERYLLTEGAEDYEGLLVAREGDAIILSLRYPAIYELEAVYADEGQSVPLEPDTVGRYRFTVPQGGVEFSVKFSNADDYARLVADLYQTYQENTDQAAEQLRKDAEAAGSPLALSLAENWKKLYLDPAYQLLLDGTDDPEQLKITGKHAFVVLGYQLQSGEMADELKGRCDAAAAAARAFPDSIIVCSGGATGTENPEGHTEAGLMKAYLTDRHGVEPSRIFIDESAMTTADNARNSLEILKAQRIESMTVITSSYHQKRGQLLYGLMAARYSMEQGYDVKILGNYNYRMDADEKTVGMDPLIALMQICEILELPDEQMSQIRQVFRPAGKP